MLNASLQSTGHSNTSEDSLCINIENISNLKAKGQYDNTSTSTPPDMNSHALPPDRGHNSSDSHQESELLETPFEAEKFELLEKLCKLDRTLSKLTEKLHYENQILHEKLKETEAQKERILKDRDETNKALTEVLKDNNLLRSRIVQMSTAHGPVHEDAYYIQRLEQLNETMKSWVAAIFKSKQIEQNLSDKDELQLCTTLNVSHHGRSLLSMMQQARCSVTEIYLRPRIRMVFVRNLISMLLCDHVFRPFCFGLSAQERRILNNVMWSVCAKGLRSLDFSYK